MTLAILISYSDIRTGLMLNLHRTEGVKGYGQRRWLHMKARLLIWHKQLQDSFPQVACKHDA